MIQILIFVFQQILIKKKILWSGTIEQSRLSLSFQSQIGRLKIRMASILFVSPCSSVSPASSVSSRISYERSYILLWKDTQDKTDFGGITGKDFLLLRVPTVCTLCPTTKCCSTFGLDKDGFLLLPVDMECQKRKRKTSKTLF